MPVLITVAETPEYMRCAERLLPAADRMAVVAYLAANPKAGDLLTVFGKNQRSNLNKAFASIKRGLQQAIRHQKGKRAGGLRLHVPPQVDVKAVRERTGLTQEQFAATFAISLGALRHWERGDRKPRGTALVLLSVIAKEPLAVLRAVDRA